MLYCNECDEYYKFGGNVRKGVCSLSESFFPVDGEQEFVYLKGQEKSCKDCSFVEDCRQYSGADDSKICGAFQDVLEDKLINILFQWVGRDEYSRRKVENLCIQFEQTPEYRFIWDYNQKTKKKEG